MTEWWYSQLIFIEKNHFYQQCTSYASAVRKSVGNAFSGDLETRISIFFPFAVRLRNTSWRHWIKQAVKKVNLWGGRGTAVEKSAWRKAWKCINYIKYINVMISLKI